MNNIHRTWKAALSFGISFFFLWLAFRKIELSDFVEALGKTSWGLIVIASVMALLAMGLRAWRWQILLLPLKRIPYHSVFSFTMIGFMANNILPAHAGEFVRAYFIGKREDIGGLSALTTIIIERLFDTIALVMLLICVLALIPVPVWLRNGGIMIGVVSLIAITVMIILAMNEGRGKIILTKVSLLVPRRFRTKVQQKLITVLEGLRILNRWQNLVKLFGLSLGIWAWMSTTIFVILWRFPLETDLGPQALMLAAMAVMVLLAFAVIIPSSPGYFGVTQLAFVFALEFFGIGEPNALACSVIFNLTQYIPITAVGIAYLFKEGLSFSEISVQENK